MNEEIIILSMLPDIGTTGVQSHFNQLCKQLKSDGYKCKIITPYTYKGSIILRALRWCSRKLIFNKEFLILVNREFNLLQIKINFKKYVKESSLNEKYFVYAQDPSSSVIAREVGSKVNVSKVVLICHFNISESYEYSLQRKTSENGLLSKYLFKKEKHALSLVDQIIFPSYFVGSHVISRNPSVKSKCQIIPNFTNYEEYSEDENFPVVDFISIGTLEVRKNQKFAIEVLKVLHELGYKKTLMIVGNGPDREMLEQLSIELGINKYVIFTGFVSNAKSLIANAKVMLHTAFLENLSIAMIESLSQGIPLAAPDTGGNPEIFADGVEGVYIDLDSAEFSAKKIVDLLEPKNYEAFRSRAKTRYKSSFSSDIIVPLLERVITGEMQ